MSTLQVFAALALVAANLMLAIDRRFVRRLRREEATTPDRAIVLTARTRLARWRLERLIRGGAIARVHGERVYLSPDGYRTFRARRRRRALTVFSIVLLLVLLAFWLTRSDS